MIKASDVWKYMESMTPLYLAEGYDNEEEADIYREMAK